MQGLEFLDVLLEGPDVVHERHHPIGGHRAGVQPGGGQQRRDVQRHRTVGGVQDEQLAPAEPQQRHLVGDLEVGKERDVPRPLDGAEQEPGGQLADVLDAHDVVRLHAVSVAGARVRLGPQQHRNEPGQVAVMTVQRHSVGEGHLSGKTRVLVRRDAPPLDRFSPHSHFQTLLEPTVLTLVAVMLVDGTVPTATTGVCQVPTDASFEETLATFAGELAVMLTGALVSADDAFDVALLPVGGPHPADHRTTAGTGRTVVVVVATDGTTAAAAAVHYRVTADGQLAERYDGTG